MNQTNLHEGHVAWFEGILYRLATVHSDTSYVWEPADNPVLPDEQEIEQQATPVANIPPTKNRHEVVSSQSSSGNQVRLNSGTITI